MHRTLRGILRFSVFGFTNARMASRLCFNAPREISAQTGRRSKSIFFSRFVAIRNPESLILRHPHSWKARAKTVARERQQVQCTQIAAGRVLRAKYKFSVTSFWASSYGHFGGGRETDNSLASV